MPKWRPNFGFAIGSTGFFKGKVGIFMAKASVAEILFICENGYEEKIIFTVDRRAGKMPWHSLVITYEWICCI